MLEHSTFSNNVADAFRANDCHACQGMKASWTWAECVPSSLRMYFSAKVNPESLRSTMRTLPKAPLPTTRSRRKWLRHTVTRRELAREPLTCSEEGNGGLGARVWRHAHLHPSERPVSLESCPSAVQLMLCYRYVPRRI